MKKTIITLLAILVISSTNLVSANGTDHKNDKMKMQIMQMQNNFMDRLKKEVNEETAKKLDEMIKSHRAEMKKMMEMVKKIKPTEEQQKQKRMEMKKRHFEDLKNILINYPSIYEKYSKEMEEIMAKIMKMRQNAKHIDKDSDSDGLSDGESTLRAIREGGRTVGAGQFMKNKGKNNTNNKADLKELAEQLVNLSIKLRNSNSNIERKKILSKIIIIVRELKHKYNIDGYRGIERTNNERRMKYGHKVLKEDLETNGNRYVNTPGVKEEKIKREKADAKRALDAFISAIVIKKGNLILNKIEKRLSKLPKRKKQVFYKKIVKKLQQIEGKIKNKEKNEIIKYIRLEIEKKISIKD